MGGETEKNENKNGNRNAHANEKENVRLDKIRGDIIKLPFP